MSKLPTSRLPVTPSKIATAPKPGLRPPQPASNPSQQASPTGGDTSTGSFALGERVTANGKSGTVAFVGSTKFAEGEWIGIVLDDNQGKNDGSYEGTRYFETEANRGLFCRPAKVQRHVPSSGASNSSDNAGDTSKAQSTAAAVVNSSQPSASTATPGTDVDSTAVNTAAATTAANLAPPAEGSSSQELKVGDRVVVSGTKFGTLKYLGKIHVAEGVWCGIQLDEAQGKNDGSVSGKRYFSCQQRYGLFSPVARVEKVNNDTTQSQIVARKASISSSTANTQPLHRSTSQESLHSNLSEFSTSSNSISRIPMRTPGKSQPQKLLNTANPYTTPNTKSLLTQAAATLAAGAPSSAQVSNLIQTIRDKDMYIEKLQQQREQDRLEFSRAAQQVDEMESRMLAFKQQFDVKESENVQLKKDQYETKQRLEDLEFQLEEYKLTETNKEHSAISVVPDGHRLLAPKDIEIYDQIKEKVLELESTNQKLILEKQTLHDEHRQELKRHGESSETELKSRLSDLERKYQDELQSKQTSDLDQVKAEYESKLTAKDQQASERLEQQKKEQQQEIDQLKSQLADLRTKEQSQSTSLSEKETAFETQIKEQQSKIEQATKEAHEAQTQLTTLQQAKEASDKQANESLVELKRYQDNVIPELEKQYQTLKSELENRDLSANTKLSERESQFEQQINEYQNSINQTTRDAEQVRTELKQIQDEFLQKENENKKLLDQLQQKYDQLQADLKDREHKASSTLSERESQYEQQIKDYQTKLEQATQDLDNRQSELLTLREEKLSAEKQLNDAIQSLKQDHERQVGQLQTQLNELQDRDRTQNMASSERESHFETQIKEYQAKRDQALQETQDVRAELVKLQGEKESQEKKLNEMVQTLKEDFTKQTESFQTQLAELENQNHTKANEQSQQEQQAKELQSNYERLKEEKDQLSEQLQRQQSEHQVQIEQLQKCVNEKHQTSEQTQQEFQQRSADLSQANEALKKDLQELQSKYTQLQTDHQQHLTSNEQLKNTNDNIVNEKQAQIDQLTKQVEELEQVQLERLEKQAKQHSESERQQSDQKLVLEKSLQDKIEEYETKMKIMQSEFMLETENKNIDHEQEKIRLKAQLQQALQAGTDNKPASASTTNVKQIEYELTDARYQIEKLQKQLANNATKDDREALEGQVNFLNDVIVELRNTNEQLKSEIEFLKNPFLGDDQYSQSTAARTSKSAPRLYCDMCEVFDQHDTDDCPKQSSLIDDQPVVESHPRDRVLPPPRVYCEKCEQFDHDCNEADETY